MERVELDLVDWTLWVLVAVDRSLDDVPELADITRPVVRLECGHRARREARPVGPVQLHRHAAPEMLGKQRHIVLTRPEWRQGDDLERQAVEKVRPELPL